MVSISVCYHIRKTLPSGRSHHHQLFLIYFYLCSLWGFFVSLMSHPHFFCFVLFRAGPLFITFLLFIRTGEKWKETMALQVLEKFSGHLSAHAYVFFLQGDSSSYSLSLSFFLSWNQLFLSWHSLFLLLTFALTPLFSGQSAAHVLPILTLPHHDLVIWNYDFKLSPSGKEGFGVLARPSLLNWKSHQKR